MYINKDYPCDTCIYEGTTTCEECGTVVSPSGKISKPRKYKCRYGRKKYDLIEVPDHVKNLVTSLIAGYNGRRRAIEMKQVSAAVSANYEKLNYCVDQAIEKLEPGLRKDILFDFERRIGYKYSHASLIISANSYFKRKRRLVYDVAKMLDLL